MSVSSSSSLMDGCTLFSPSYSPFFLRANTLSETEPSDIDAHIALPFVWMYIHMYIIIVDCRIRYCWCTHTSGLFYSTLFSNTQVQ